MNSDDERRRYWASACSMRPAVAQDGSTPKSAQAPRAVVALFDSDARQARHARPLSQAGSAPWRKAQARVAVIEVDDGELCAASAEAGVDALTLALATLRQRLESAGLDPRTAVSASERLSEYLVADGLNTLLGTDNYVAELTEKELALAAHVNTIWRELVGAHECETGHIGVVPGGVRRLPN